MTRKQINFYALQADITCVLAYVETKLKLKYLLAGRCSQLPEPRNWRQLETLGRATSKNAISSATFLVAKEETQIVPRQIGDQFVFDQLLNPDTVIFTPSGLWDDSTILSGRVATASTTRNARTLMSLFHSGFQKNFQKVRAYFVGPEALRCSKSGMRLTSSVQSPPEYDLKPYGD